MRKFEPILSKIKSVATGNLWTKTSGIFVFIFGCIAVAADALEIKDKLFSSNPTEEKVTVIDTIQGNKVLTDSASSVLKSAKAPTNNSTKPPSKTKKVPKPVYFNENEFLLENSAVALLIKNNKNRLDLEFQQRLGDDLLEKNTNSSSSFFSNTALANYNKFYNPNKGFLDQIKIEKHLRRYLIGSFKQVKSKSTADSQITVVHIKFQGKLIDLSANSSKIIKEEVRETNYQEFRAVENALSQLTTKIANSF